MTVLLFFSFSLFWYVKRQAKRASGQSIQDGKQEGDEQLDRKRPLYVRGAVVCVRAEDAWLPGRGWGGRGISAVEGRAREDQEHSSLSS